MAYVRQKLAKYLSSTSLGIAWRAEHGETLVCRGVLANRAKRHRRCYDSFGEQLSRGVTQSAWSLIAFEGCAVGAVKAGGGSR